MGMLSHNIYQYKTMATDLQKMQIYYIDVYLYVASYDEFCVWSVKF